MTVRARVVLDPADVDRMLGDGELDTVVCALPDLWGRLVGKRVTARTFRRLMRESGGLHASLYLFVVDMDMEPQPGFAVSDWERGFQDFLMLPDLSTLRLVPWLEKTALVLCDAVIEQTGAPVEVSPRQILRRQIARAAERGLTVKCGSELEVYFFADGYRDAWAREYRGLRQHEINLEYADALEMADRHAIYKNGIKEIAALTGLSATFMAKWSLDDIG